MDIEDGLILGTLGAGGLCCCCPCISVFTIVGIGFGLVGGVISLALMPITLPLKAIFGGRGKEESK